MSTVLIVDDSGVARRRARTILEAAGYRVTEVEDGMAAIESYFLDKPDIVLLDLVMRGMHGFDVLSKLRQMDQEARIIVASADIQSSTHTMVKAAGAVAFVTKPFSAEQVIEAVNAAIEGESYGIE